MSFRRITTEETSAAHSAYIEVYVWLNAKGIRQWLRPLSKETFVERQRDGQLFGFYVDMARKVIIFVLLLFLGTAGAFLASWIVGLIWPRARLPVFVLIALWWCWTGWRYAKARDRGQF